MALLSDTRVLWKNIRCFTALVPRRYRVKKKWAATLPKISSSKRALQNFDVNYSTQFGESWPIIRASLLSEQKYGALVNNFSLGTTDLQGASDFIYEGVMKTLDTNNRDNQVSNVHPTQAAGMSESVNSASEMEAVMLSFGISPNIKCFTFPKGDISRFKPARQDSFGILEYYLLDAASVLPVLALDVRPGNVVLDLCAAPGGKTLALLQTQACWKLAVNDSSVSRTDRLKRVLQSYLPREHYIKENIRITSFDGRKWGDLESRTFDRVLVDVPCTTDRHSLLEDENNIFAKHRAKEREMLPILQMQLLLAGIQATKQGGEVVYSTCTLSQFQNECVVEQAIQIAEEELGRKIQIVDLSLIAQLFRNTFYFAQDVKLGELVVPQLSANFGPMYFCKMRCLN
ncbi:5-methylcytosine rRNA methyltransferase NSUN4 [Erpetoichthys calabaricus]|uniref:5-cytosine rRNA methyltransferase NSUN4 n=1 Tax=Erpetoichthys calabaricus TaxID=27687 RepID=A0A8C4TCC9_ERPCA|nr:5-methylcytosine rRNA methyltransferase NSUN4 [Erpetoichthys calabaricus]